MVDVLTLWRLREFTAVISLGLALLLPHPNHPESTHHHHLCQVVMVGRPSRRWSPPAASWLFWCLKVNLQDAFQICGCSSHLQCEECDLYARPAGVCHQSEPLCHLFILVIQQHMAEWLLIGHPFKVIKPVYAKETYVLVLTHSNWNFTPVFDCRLLPLKMRKTEGRSFAAPSGRNSGPKCLHIVEHHPNDTPWRTEVLQRLLYQEHQKISSLCANPSQISSGIVLWKERCLGCADGSDSPRRALIVCLSRKKPGFYFLKNFENILKFW